MGKYETFVIRLWTEEDADYEHGEIRHVRSGTGLRFRRVQDAMMFIQKFIALRQADKNKASPRRLTPH